jgi:hypothetical protein
MSYLSNYAVELLDQPRFLSILFQNKRIYEEYSLSSLGDPETVYTGRKSTHLAK